MKKNVGWCQFEAHFFFLKDPELCLAFIDKDIEFYSKIVCPRCAKIAQKSPSGRLSVGTKTQKQLLTKVVPTRAAREAHLQKSCFTKAHEFVVWTPSFAESIGFTVNCDDFEEAEPSSVCQGVDVRLDHPGSSLHQTNLGAYCLNTKPPSSSQIGLVLTVMISNLDSSSRFSPVSTHDPKLQRWEAFVRAWSLEAKFSSSHAFLWLMAKNKIPNGDKLAKKRKLMIKLLCSFLTLNVIAFSFFVKF